MNIGDFGLALIKHWGLTDETANPEQPQVVIRDEHDVFRPVRPVRRSMERVSSGAIVGFQDVVVLEIE